MSDSSWTKEFPRRAGAYFLRWPDGRREIAQCAVTTPAIMGEFGGEDFCVADGVMSAYRAGSADAEPDYVFAGAEWFGPISPESFERSDAPCGDTQEVARQIVRAHIDWKDPRYKLLADAITQALRDERERCAKAICLFCAEPEHYGPPKEMQGSKRLWHADLRNDCNGVVQCQAAAIRKED